MSLNFEVSESIVLFCCFEVRWLNSTYILVRFIMYSLTLYFYGHWPWPVTIMLFSSPSMIYTFSKHSWHKKALTRGRTDHDSTKNSANNQQYGMSHRASIKCGTLSLTFKLDLARIKLNHHARLLRQWSFTSKVILWTDRHTHTVDRLLYQDVWSGVAAGVQESNYCDPS